MDAELFGEGLADRLLTQVSCTGDELTLLECPASVFSGFSCVTAGVACQGGWVGRSSGFHMMSVTACQTYIVHEFCYAYENIRLW